MIIDAHAHLWKSQKGLVSGKPVFDVGNGKSDFCGTVRQMMPPYITDGFNSAERFMANMDYADITHIQWPIHTDDARKHLQGCSKQCCIVGEVA